MTHRRLAPTDSVERGRMVGQAPDPIEERSGGSGRSLLVAMLIFVACLVWAGVAMFNVGRAALELREARSALIAAERALGGSDLSAAREHLDVGVASATRSSRLLHQPYMRPLLLIPVVAPNLRAVTALSDAARDAGEAGSELLAIASTIVHDDRESVYGEISLSYLEDLQVPTRRFADALEHGTARVQDAGSEQLLGPVGAAREAYLDLAVPATEQTAIGADILEVMPQFLGGNGTRRYLVAAGTLSELRASGGLMGSWSVMTADAGRLEFDTFVDVDLLPSPEVDVAPVSAEYAARYAPLGSLRQWRNVNLSPEFPSAARTMLQMWESDVLPPLDGVIMADSVTFARIADRAGGLEVPGVGTFGPQEVLDFVALDAYAAFEDDDERKEVLGAVATSAFARMFDIIEDDDVPETVRLLSGLAGDGHLRIYSRDPEVQSVLERAGVAGGLPEVDGEFAGVYVNNVAANKVDYFTTRRLEHRVRLLPDGVTRSVVSATFSNDAPREGYPRAVLGPWTQHTEAGDNLSLVSVLCGRGCAIPDPPDGVTVGGTELGRPVVDVRLLLPASTSRTVQVETETTDGWYVENDQIVVPVAHHVQPTLRPSALRVSVAVPDGWVPTALPDGAQRVGGDIVWEQWVSGVTRTEFRLVRRTDDTSVADPGDGFE